MADAEAPTRTRAGTTRRGADRVALALLGALLIATADRGDAAAIATTALVPWLLAVERARPSESMWLGAWFGAVYGVFLALWIPDALESLNASSAASFSGFIAICVWAGAPVFAALGLVAHATRGYPSTARALGLAAMIFVAEWIISRTWWGVPWGLLGYSQRDVPGVAQLAVVAGVPGISALLAAMNVAIADVLRRRPGALRLASSLATGWLALAFFGLPLAEALRPPEPHVRPTTLLAIQPDIPRGERWGDRFQALNLHRIRTITARALEAEPPGIDAVVLPENLLTTPIENDPDLARALEAWVDELGLPVLTGLVLAAEAPAPRLYRNAVVWIEPGRGITARLDKERAIPLLESSREFPGSAILAPLFGPASHWEKVEEAETSKPLAGPIPVTPILCYEVLFPALAAKRHTPESVALVNLADDSWTRGETATRHLAGIARFRAIERRSTLVRVAHGGLSLVVDPFGRVIHALPLDTYSSLRLSVRPEPPPAPLERAGLLALPLGAGLLVWWLAGVVATHGRRGDTPDSRGTP